MGVSQSSVAVRGKAPAIVRDLLGLKLTGVCEAYAESGINGVELPGNWYAVISNRDRLRLMEEQKLRQLSSDCELVACFVEEHCMESSAVAWRNGQQIWSVVRNAQKGKRHFESSGELPSAFAEIHDRWQARQKVEDAAMKRVDCIFEIPVELAHSVTGYRYDDDLPGLKDRPYEILVETELKAPKSGGEPGKRSWFHRLFNT